MLPPTFFPIPFFFLLPRFVAWPLELGLGTHNPRLVLWPLELGLGTHNPRFVPWPLELGLGTLNPRFVAWLLESGLGTRNPRFVAWPLELGLGTHNPRKCCTLALANAPPVRVEDPARLEPPLKHPCSRPKGHGELLRHTTRREGTQILQPLVPLGWRQGQRRPMQLWQRLHVPTPSWFDCASRTPPNADPSPED